jgi:hypothetical protein
MSKRTTTANIENSKDSGFQAVVARIGLLHWQI